MCSALRRSCPAVRLCAVMTLIGVLCVRVAPIAQAQTLAITFVQANSSTPQSSQPIVSAPYTLSQTTGSLNVVVIGWRDSIAHVQSVSDSTGNTYTLAVGPTTQTGLATQSIYFAKNIQPSAAGANLVTVTFDQPATLPDLRIAEYGGVDAVNPLDIAGGLAGTGNTANSGGVATTNAYDLLVGADCCG
jgi:hypothetical protein